MASRADRGAGDTGSRVRRERLLRLLESVAAGRADPRAALDELSWLPVEAVDGDGGATPFARIDHHRALRQGYPEVVFGLGKTPEQTLEIARRIARRGDGFLVTRADEATRALLGAEFPDARASVPGRIVHLPPTHAAAPTGAGPVLVLSAGTGDLPVAEEAAVTAEAMGNPVERLYDVGVAGLHRLLDEAAPLRRASVVIVVAGMEGALPSVVAGLVAAPVIGVPTSVGYGAAMEGFTALLGMLSSCAAGLTVVNIDNGFGAACAATRMNQPALRPA